MIKTYRFLAHFFDQGNVAVFGMRGSGKDVAFGNVIARRGMPYASNTYYGGACSILDFTVMRLGGNKFQNFVEGNLKYYSYPFDDGTDIYIADAGVYLPAQYHNELLKLYPEMPLFQALSRHVGDANVHFNVQHLGRVWDKLREQCDIYIKCERCYHFLGFVLQKVTIYDRYDSALARVKPFRLKLPLFAGKALRFQRDLAQQSYDNAHGSVRSYWIFGRNKSKHDTRFFKKALEEGVTRET